MSLPITIDSAQEWIEKVPSLLLTLEDLSEILHNEQLINYLAMKLENYYNQVENLFTASILQILNEGTESGKLILLNVLLKSTNIWNNLAKINNLQPILTELALTPDKIFTQAAITLSQKLVKMTAEVKSEGLAPEKLELDDFVSRDIGGIPEEYGEEKREESRAKKAKKISAPPPKPARSTMPPTPPSSASPPAAPSSSTFDLSASVELAEKEYTKPESEEPIAGCPEEPSPDLEEMEDLPPIDDEVGVEESFIPAPQEITDEKEPRKIFTHIHYFNRMNSRKTYPFKVSLSSIAKKLKTRRMHILTGERETETQAEFELDQATRQIMVELLISGCLVQPTFQYVDPEPDNLPAELIYYVTPLVEAGFSSSKLEGELILKSDLGLILQKISLEDVSVVSNRISKIAAVVGAIGGGTLPALDFLFGVSLQEALSGQLAYTAPDIADSIDIRSAITVTQIAIFFIFIGFGLLWWWRKGRSRRASRERLPIDIPS